MSELPKARIATASLAGCFGCHMAILDIDERLIELMKLVDVDRSPLTDKKRFTQRCDIGIIEGGCCNEENVHVLHDFRRNCDVLIALGQCAIMGGLAGHAQRDHAFRRAAQGMPGRGLYHRQIYPQHDPQRAERSGAAAVAGRGLSLLARWSRSTTRSRAAPRAATSSFDTLAKLLTGKFRGFEREMIKFD